MDVKLVTGKLKRPDVSKEHSTATLVVLLYDISTFEDESAVFLQNVGIYSNARYTV